MNQKQPKLDLGGLTRFQIRHLDWAYIKYSNEASNTTNSFSFLISIIACLFFDPSDPGFFITKTEKLNGV